MVKTRDIILILILIILDQLSKFYFKDKNFFIFNYTKNTGAAFSILQDYTLFLILISILVISFTLYYFIKLKKINKSLRIAFILILSGTLGNLIDRVFLDYVRDFIDLKIWPIFNLADSYNVIGFILVVIYFYKKK
mgnify:CR=1 FL=1